MSSSTRHPIRLSVYTTDGVYYPRELTESNGILYLIYEDGSIITLNKTAVTKITDANDNHIGTIDPVNGGTIKIPDASDSNRGLTIFGTITPKAAGTASVGKENSVSRSDHIHPEQIDIKGNAETATKFKTETDIILTGDVTGKASSQAGWSLETELKDSGVTDGEYGPQTGGTLDYGGTFTTPCLTLDSKGRVTKASNITHTLPSKSTPESIGFGHGICNTGYGIAIKEVSLPGYELVTGGQVSVTFNYNVQAEASLDINGKGAHPIATGTSTYIEDGIINAGDIATFVYSGGYYFLLSIDRRSRTYNVSIEPSWSGSAAPYTQTISVSGISSGDNPIVDIIPDYDYDTAATQMKEYCKIYKITTSNDYITIYASELTTVPIQIQLKCIRP